MVDDIFDTSRPHGLVEIRTGVGQCCWSEEQKDQIIAESYLAGAIVSEVARRHESPASVCLAKGSESWADFRYSAIVAKPRESRLIKDRDLALCFMRNVALISTF